MTMLVATLPPAPGVNDLYGTGHNNGSTNFYKTERAQSWVDAAPLYLRKAGWRRLPAGKYALSVSLILYTKRQDIDAPLKALLDAIAETLGIDDRNVYHLDIDRFHVDDPAEQKVRVFVSVVPAAELDRLSTVESKPS